MNTKGERIYQDYLGDFFSEVHLPVGDYLEDFFFRK